MAIYPGARVRLIDRSFLPGNGIPMAAYNRSNTHTQAGNGSLYGYYSRTGRPSSHGWVAKVGVLEQYVDTSLRAEADLQGNDATISIEVEGGEEPYTTAQIDALIPWHVWVLTTHGMAKKIAIDSKVGSSSHGLSWHRMGINGNFPALPSPYAGRLQRGGGMLYSSATGKTCPTNPRIDQLVNIIYPNVLAIVGGGPVTPVPNPVPTPTPPPAHPSWWIDEDGLWGRGTNKLLQMRAGTIQDGELWGQYKPNAQPAFVDGWVYNYPTVKGSPAWRWAQGRLGTPQDGVFGQTDLRAMQARAGYPYDGRLDKPSNTVKWFQHALNTNTL